VFQVDAANDLALLKADGRFAPLPILPSRSAQLGSMVATIGFPDPSLQGFTPKVLEHGHHRGNRVAVRRSRLPFWLLYIDVAADVSPLKFKSERTDVHCYGGGAGFGVLIFILLCVFAP
jgi:hypothetical protein